MEVQTSQVTAQDLKVSNSNPTQAKPTPGVKRPVKPAQGQAPKPKPTAGGKPGAGPKKPAGPPIDKSQFTDEELKDPDCLDNLKTLSVLEFKHNKYEEIRSKIDGRTPRDLMQKIIRIKCKRQSLEDALGTDISPQDYLGLLKITFDHDKKLAEYFKQIGDKDKSIINSNQWIGAVEVNLVLNELLGIDNQIIYISSGKEMNSKGRELIKHFECNGTPVMIGGGVYAYTILGVDYDRIKGECKFLILDPHYSGEDDLKSIINKGFCAWKGIDLFKKEEFYNMCLPQIN
jgi:hypothetical protein